MCERSVGLGVRLNLRLERLLFGVLTNGETDLSGLPSEHAEDRGTVVSHRATPLALVGSTAGGILRIRMQLALLSGVLEHLVGLGLPVTQRGLGLVLQSELLDAAPVLQQIAAVQRPNSSARCEVGTPWRNPLISSVTIRMS